MYLRSAFGLVAVLCPFAHKLGALVEQIAAPVSRFDLIAHAMRQRHFTNLAWVIGALGCPVPERRTEAVYG